MLICRDIFDSGHNNFSERKGVGVQILILDEEHLCKSMTFENQHCNKDISRFDFVVLSQVMIK